MKYCNTNFTQYEDQRTAEKYRGKYRQTMFCTECSKYHNVPPRIKKKIKKDRKNRNKEINTQKAG